MFTADALATVLVLTIVLGVMATEYEIIVSRITDVEMSKLKLLADDISEILVHRYISSRDPLGTNIPNKVNKDDVLFEERFNEFVNMLNKTFNYYGVSHAEISIYWYDGVSYSPSLTWEYQGGCGTNPMRVISKRAIINDPYIYAPLEGSSVLANVTDCGYVEVILC